MIGLTAGEVGRLGLVALTQLGDAWFLFALLLVVHWYRPERFPAGRRASAVVIATTLVAVASVLTAKTVFAQPRPPGATTASVPSWLPPVLADAVREGATSDGYAFPSGHAVVSTVAYGCFAALAGGNRMKRRPLRSRNWLVAATLVGAIAASRVALGVHYPRDVVAGIALGSVVLATGLWLDDPDRTLGLAVVVALVGTAIAAKGTGTAELPDAVGTLGGCVGGLVAWRWSGPVATRVPLGLVVVGGSLLTVIWAVSISLDTLAVIALGNAVAVGLGIGFPAVVEAAMARVAKAK
jgi:membrane-associated phospholipid phosphatase